MPQVTLPDGTVLTLTDVASQSAVAAIKTDGTQKMLVSQSGGVPAPWTVVAASESAPGMMTPSHVERIAALENSTTGTDLEAEATARQQADTGLDERLTIAEGGIQALEETAPTADEKAALAGSNGAPSLTNPFITDSDPRNEDARTPTPHAASHATGQPDALAPADIGAVPSTRTVNGHALSADVTVTKGDVGLGNVDNTSDLAKPVSTAQAAALALKAALTGSASQAFSALTPAMTDNSSRVATTAYARRLKRRWGGYPGPRVPHRNHLTSNAWLPSTSAADNQWRSVCWAPELGLFCAVALDGTGNRVMTSPDGITWTARSSAVDNQWYSVCWAPELGLFCAVAYSGTAGTLAVTSRSAWSYGYRAA